MQTNWTEICGSDLTVWDSRFLTKCFQEFAIALPAYALMTICCSYYLGRNRPTYNRLPSHLALINFRMVIAFFIFLFCILKTLASYFYDHGAFTAIDYVWVILSSAAWLLHITLLYSLRRRISFQMRGPLPLILTSVLTFAASVVDLCGFVLNDNPAKGEIYHLLTRIMILALHLCLFTTLFPNGPASFGYRVLRSITERDSEREPLLGGRPFQEDDEQLGVAEDNYGILSRLTFYWVLPLLRKGSRGALGTCRDLHDLPKSMTAETISFKINQCLRQMKEDFHSRRIVAFLEYQEVEFEFPKRFLFTLLNKCFGVEFYSLGFLKIVADGLTFAGPILLNKIITFLEDKSEPMANGYWYASSLFALSFLASFLGTHYTYLVQRISLKVRSAVIGLIYRKTLGVSRRSLSTFNTGEIMDFMSTDADRIGNFCQSFHQSWSLPFQIGGVLFLLHQQIGLSFLAGFTFAILLVPLNWKITSKIASLTADWMARKDKRLKLMSEVVSGIRVIKMYAWEEDFSQRIEIARNEELLFLKKKKYLDAFCVYFWATTPILIAVSTFTMYALLGNTLTAAKVFTSLALFRMLITPLNAFPWVVNGVIESWISLCRLERFMNLEELNLSKYYTVEKEDDSMVEIMNGRFHWNRENLPQPETLPFTLGPLDLILKKGKLLGIAGQVGSGKSTLLSAILADVRCSDGTIALEPTCLTYGVGYVSQEPWLQHATIQQNILFGKSYNVAYYRRVLEACVLIDDLKQFPAGDQTEVGERGITLSGGQKARVSLARAVYQDLDLYLLDDPFSAVDIHVARKIYKSCLRGLLRDKTVVLCTHHVQYLLEADHVLVLSDGAIVKQGLPADVLQMEFYKEVEEEHSRDIKEARKPESATEESLVKEEERGIGTIELHVYHSYWLAVSTLVGTLCLLAFFLMQSSSIISDWWLAYWSSNAYDNTTSNMTFFLMESGDLLDRVEKTRSVTFYLAVYCSLACANSLFTMARAFLFAYGGIRAAVTVHSQLLRTIVKAPVKFFDSTPLGRILNRFSSDLNMVDDSLPFVLNMFIAHAFNVLGIIVVTCYGIPWMIALLIPLGIIYYYIQRFYRVTSRELKRLYSVTLSPMYVHFSETIAGLTTIRSMAATRRFCQENEAKLDMNQQAGFAGLATAQWLSMVLQMIGVIVLTAVAFFAVLQHHYSVADPGIVGLTMSYTLSLTLLLSKLIAAFTETEKEMVSMERMQQYIENVQCEEKDYILQTPNLWPELGSITFRKVTLRYNPSHPPALKAVSFEILPGEKVGIVGRTGAGKSSIFQALFRMVPLEGGEILVDGINIYHLNLQQYRSRLAIIPQDPFLFSGSVLENLDPRGIFSGPELWQTLEQCHLLDCVKRLGGLEGEVGERGQNLSVGQRQLFCLARALLCRAKVICLDEATASVDHETDQAIQETIRHTFQESTVLTIAHRIETVLDADRVLIMDGGNVVRFGPARKVLEHSSHLASFLNEPSAS